MSHYYNYNSMVSSAISYLLLQEVMILLDSTENHNLRVHFLWLAKVLAIIFCFRQWVA